jgi:hypothetical protein
MQRFTQERGQSHSVPEEGATSRMNGSVDLNQDGFPLCATEFTNHRISLPGFFYPEERVWENRVGNVFPRVLYLIFQHGWQGLRRNVEGLWIKPRKEIHEKTDQA